jgi:hypothetical protein
MIISTDRKIRAKLPATYELENILQNDETNLANGFGLEC